MFLVRGGSFFYVNRLAIYYAEEKQKNEAEKFIDSLNNAQSPSIVTELKPLHSFYKAEDYHKDYYNKNRSAPYCEIVINPKLAKLKERFKDLI